MSEAHVSLRDGQEGASAKDSAATKRPSAVAYKVGGHYYTMKSAPNCRTCQSHYRTDIEKSILSGYGYASIIHHLPKDAALNERLIADHVKNGHLPLDQAIRQGIIEDRAREMGKQMDSAVGTVVDHIAFARVGIQKTFEDITQGRQTPTIAEAIAMGNMLQKAEQFSQGTEVDNYVVMQGFATMMELVRNMLNPQDYREFGERLAATPFLRSLMGQQPVLELQGEEVD